jgi:hypothetical protein
VSLRYSRVSRGIPPLLQVDLWNLHDDLKSFRITSTDLESIHGSITSLHISREWLSLSVVCLHCSRRLLVGDPPMLKIDTLKVDGNEK